MFRWNNLLIFLFSGSSTCWTCCVQVQQPVVFKFSNLWIHLHFGTSTCWTCHVQVHQPDEPVLFRRYTNQLDLLCSGTATFWTCLASRWTLTYLAGWRSTRRPSHTATPPGSTTTRSTHRTEGNSTNLLTVKGTVSWDLLTLLLNKWTWCGVTQGSRAIINSCKNKVKKSHVTVPIMKV